MSKKRRVKNYPQLAPTRCDVCRRGEGQVGDKCNNCGVEIEGGPGEQLVLELAIRENLSPAGVAALVMALQPAGSITATTPEGERALRQVVWFKDMLLEMIGVETFNQTMDDLGF
jgi:hypothetical protein